VHFCGFFANTFHPVGKGRRYCERDVAVYLLTSSEDPMDIRRAKAGGVTKYLLKSPLYDDLI